MTKAQPTELGQVRVYKDAVGVRSTYEDFEVGKDLGTAVLFITQDQIEEDCFKRDYYHPWYSIDSPFGGTIVPIEMTYMIGRWLFSRHYNVVGLFYKWSFEFLAPVRTNVRYEFSGRTADKSIRNDREFVAYEGTCKDAKGNVVFTTRRAHVLDYIKRTAPRVGESGLDSVDMRATDSPFARDLAAMAAAAAAAPRSSKPTKAATPASVIEVNPLASRDTKLGQPLPLNAIAYSQARFDRDWGTGEGAVGPGTRSRHYDQTAANQEGLPAPITGGPWVMGLIFQSAIQFFGEGWLRGGRADLTMARPVFVGDFVTAKGFVKGQELLSDGSVRLICEVWVESQTGEKKTVGTISGIVR